MKTLFIVLCVMLGAVAVVAYAEGPPAVEVHGWTLTRYYADTVVEATRDINGDIVNEQKENHLEWERISLSGLARLPENKQLYGEIYIHPWLPNTDPSFLYLESLYLDTPAGPGAKIRIGKGRSYAFGLTPSYGVRKTSNYGPLAEAFTMDRVLGIQYMQTKGQDSVNFGIFNAQRPGTRLIGMAADAQIDHPAFLANTVVTHLTDRDVPADRSGQLEASARIGRQFSSILNVGASGRVGRMDATDAAFLTSKFPTYTGERTRTRYGLDSTFKSAPFFGEAELYIGDTGGIDQTGWSVLLGIEPTNQCSLPWRSFSAACKGLFVRYTSLDIDVPVTTNSITWDTQQWAISYVYPLHIKNRLSPKWVQIEYERNMEDPPAGLEEVPNNVFFIELFTAF
jgi:hypothetical protein